MTAAPEPIPELTETWLPVVGFPDYEVSNLGRVKSKARTVVTKKGIRRVLCECIMSPAPNPDTTYYQLRLVIDNVFYTKTIHRLVATAHIPNPENKPLVDHIDKNRHNNCVSNLRWVTYAENARNRHNSAISGHSNIVYKGVPDERESWRVIGVRDGVRKSATYRTLADALAGRLALLGF